MIHDKKIKKIKLHFFFFCLLKRYVHFISCIYLNFPLEGDKSMGLCPRYVFGRPPSVVVSRLFHFIWLFSHCFSHLIICVIFLGDSLLEGVYFFIFSIWGFEGADKRGIGVVGSELRLLYCFRFLSGIEMLELNSSETCGTDEVIGGKKKKTTGASRTEGGAERGSSGCVFFRHHPPPETKKNNQTNFFLKNRRRKKRVNNNNSP
jgi:hypothetical protein